MGIYDEINSYVQETRTFSSPCSIIRGSNVRNINRKWLERLRDLISRQGWKPDSYIYVVPVEDMGNWRPRGMGAKLRRGSKYYCVDGMHRVLALQELERDGIQMTFNIAVMRHVRVPRMLYFAYELNQAHYDTLPSTYGDRLGMLRQQLSGFLEVKEMARTLFSEMKENRRRRCMKEARSRRNSLVSAFVTGYLRKVITLDTDILIDDTKRDANLMLSMDEYGSAWSLFRKLSDEKRSFPGMLTRKGLYTQGFLDAEDGLKCWIFLRIFSDFQSNKRWPESGRGRYFRGVRELYEDMCVMLRKANRTEELFFGDEIEIEAATRRRVSDKMRKDDELKRFLHQYMLESPLNLDRKVSLAWRECFVDSKRAKGSRMMSALRRNCPELLCDFYRGEGGGEGGSEGGGDEEDKDKGEGEGNDQGEDEDVEAQLVEESRRKKKEKEARKHRECEREKKEKERRQKLKEEEESRQFMELEKKKRMEREIEEARRQEEGKREREEEMRREEREKDEEEVQNDCGVGDGRRNGDAVDCGIQALGNSAGAGSGARVGDDCEGFQGGDGCGSRGCGSSGHAEGDDITMGKGEDQAGLLLLSQQASLLLEDDAVVEDEKGVRMDGATRSVTPLATDTHNPDAFNPPGGLARRSSLGIPSPCSTGTINSPPGGPCPPDPSPSNSPLPSSGDSNPTHSPNEGGISPSRKRPRSPSLPPLSDSDSDGTDEGEESEGDGETKKKMKKKKKRKMKKMKKKKRARRKRRVLVLGKLEELDEDTRDPGYEAVECSTGKPKVPPPPQRHDYKIPGLIAENSRIRAELSEEDIDLVMDAILPLPADLKRGEKIGELRGLGYAVLPGAAGNLKKDISSLLHYLEEPFDSYPTDESSFGVWNRIFNGERGPEVLAKDERIEADQAKPYTDRRFQFSDRAGETLKREVPSHFAEKLRIDAFLAEYLKRYGFFPDEQYEFPYDGSRVLATVRPCGRQRPHVDYVQGHTDIQEEDQDVQYFSMMSGEDGFDILAWEGSHKIFFGASEEKQELLKKCLPVRSVRVPPFSIAVFRGDLVHAGEGLECRGSARKGFGSNKNVQLRFHVYVKKRRTTIWNVTQKIDMQGISW